MGQASSRAAQEANSNQATAQERETLLLTHLPTVRFLAHKIHKSLPHFVEIDDLYSAGIMGLIDAISHFDTKRGVEFRSFAQLRIRGAILDSLRKLDWAPNELRKKGRAVAEAARLVSHRAGHTPDQDEIAAEMHISLSAYQSLASELNGLEIENLYAREDNIEGDPFDRLPDKRDEDPLAHCLKGELKQKLDDDFKVLPEKERQVLTLYYYEELTMKEIGKLLGVGEARVSQIHASAILRLRIALACLRNKTPPTQKDMPRVNRTGDGSRSHPPISCRRLRDGMALSLLRQSMHFLYKARRP